MTTSYQSKSQSALLGIFVLLLGVVSVMGLLAPESREYRMPIWFIEAAICGVFLDRHFNKRS